MSRKILLTLATFITVITLASSVSSLEIRVDHSSNKEADQNYLCTYDSACSLCSSEWKNFEDTVYLDNGKEGITLSQEMGDCKTSRVLWDQIKITRKGAPIYSETWEDGLSGWKNSSDLGKSGGEFNVKVSQQKGSKDSSAVMHTDGNCFVPPYDGSEGHLKKKQDLKLTEGFYKVEYRVKVNKSGQYSYCQSDSGGLGTIIETNSSDQDSIFELPNSIERGEEIEVEYSFIDNLHEKIDIGVDTGKEKIVAKTHKSSLAGLRGGASAAANTLAAPAGTQITVLDKKVSGKFTLDSSLYKPGKKEMKLFAGDHSEKVEIEVNSQDFIIKEAQISKNTVEKGGNIEVNTRIRNPMGTSDTQDFQLNWNSGRYDRRGAKSETKSVSLNAGETKQVTWNWKAPQKVGIYSMWISGPDTNFLENIEVSNPKAEVKSNIDIQIHENLDQWPQNQYKVDYEIENPTDEEIISMVKPEIKCFKRSYELSEGYQGSSFPGETEDYTFKIEPGETETGTIEKSYAKLNEDIGDLGPTALGNTECRFQVAVLDHEGGRTIVPEESDVFVLSAVDVFLKEDNDDGWWPPW